jgi:hypothetical protein
MLFTPAFDEADIFSMHFRHIFDIFARYFIFRIFSLRHASSLFSLHFFDRYFSFRHDAAYG